MDMQVFSTYRFTDAVRRRVLIYRDPAQGRYQSAQEAKGDEVLAVEAFPDITFSVSAILG